MMKKKESVFYLEQNVIDFRKRLDVCNALMAGQEFVKDKSTKYLIKRAIEGDEQYEDRLQMSHLTNAFKLAVNQWSLSLSNLNIIINTEDYPELADLQKKADVNNNNLNVFLSKVLNKAISLGCTGVVVDYPHIDSNALTKEDVKGERPYLRIINFYTDLLGYRLDIDKKLTSIRILIEDHVSSNNNYSKEHAYFVRELILEDGVVVSKLQSYNKDSHTDVLINEQKSDFNEIPILPLVLGEELDPLLAILSPVQGLADLDMKLYNAESLQTGAISLCLTPILFVAGATTRKLPYRRVDEDTDLTDNSTRNIVSNSYDYINRNSRLKTSSSTVIETSKSASEVSMEYKQPNSAPIELSFKQISEIKAAMRTYGIDISASNENDLATTKIIDNDRITNMLKGFISEIENLIEKISKLYMNFYNKNYDDKATIDYNFDRKELTTQQIQLIELLLNNGSMSSEHLYEKVLRPRFKEFSDLSWDDILESINNENLNVTVTNTENPLDAIMPKQ